MPVSAAGATLALPGRHKDIMIQLVIGYCRGGAAGNSSFLLVNFKLTRDSDISATGPECRAASVARVRG